MKPRVLLIDNYDSFTHNLFQLFAIAGAEVRVVRNDEIDLAGIDAHAPSHVVLSPGPGHPDRTRDFGVCRDVLAHRATRFPILGVCLGHQGIASVAGARVVRAPSPQHGKTDRVSHDGTGLFAGASTPLSVMRYHSLVVEESTLPTTLRVTARNEAGLVMALRHTKLPIAGVQFHPESIGTPEGDILIRNFLAWGSACA